MGDSISEGTLKRWTKQVGEFVKQDDEVASIETDKVDVSVNAPEDGILKKLFANEEDTVAVGADLFVLETGVDASNVQSEVKETKKAEAEPKKVETAPASPPKVETPQPVAPRLSTIFSS